MYWHIRNKKKIMCVVTKRIFEKAFETFTEKKINSNKSF